MGGCSCKSESDLQGEIVGQNRPNQFSIKPESFVHLNHGTINNMFEIGDIIGEGRNSIIRLVTNKQTLIKRAMKKIMKDQITLEEKADLIEEVNIQKQLDHPHIARLFEQYEDDTSYYMIFEYIPGGELFEKIKKLSNFSEKMAAEFIKQILSALAYLEEMNIVHRDIKPEKILLTDNTDSINIKLIDFGTAKKINGVQKLSNRIGSQYYVAPEVLDGSYDFKCDVWSCGVILYILLCGYPPFMGRSREETFQNIRSGKFEFNPEEWDNISDQAKDLIKKILTIDPQERLSASQAHNHPWVQENSIEVCLDQKTVKNLGNFQGKNKFKSAIMAIIATQIMTSQEKELLRGTFLTIDQNGDGLLTKDELYQGFMKVYNDEAICSQLVDTVFQSVDQNQSGKVDFTEFIIAAASSSQILTKSKLKQAFKILDSDGNGFITREEFKEVLSDVQVDDNSWNAIMQQVDKNNDGYVYLLTRIH